MNLDICDTLLCHPVPGRGHIPSQSGRIMLIVTRAPGTQLVVHSLYFEFKG